MLQIGVRLLLGGVALFKDGAYIFYVTPVGVLLLRGWVLFFLVNCYAVVIPDMCMSTYCFYIVWIFFTLVRAFVTLMSHNNQTRQTVAFMSWRFFAEFLIDLPVSQWPHLKTKVQSWCSFAITKQNYVPAPRPGIQARTITAVIKTKIRAVFSWV